ncbi:MAG TPA: hypothetical protein VM265_05360 [Sphingomicrobium sp.]|nr:hypothetical protein [Sphingomicrobium sp.]
MKLNNWTIAGIAAIAMAAAGCQTAQEGGDAAGTAGTQGTSGTSTGSGGTGTRMPGLVSVNLENVLNDLSVALSIDRANIPVNAQIPIDVAANVCGVSVSVLSVSTGGTASCTARTATPQLAQVVQQQIAAGGNVGGGDQGGSTASTGTTNTTDPR